MWVWWDVWCPKTSWWLCIQRCLNLWLKHRYLQSSHFRYRYPLYACDLPGTFSFVGGGGAANCFNRLWWTMRAESFFNVYRSGSVERVHNFSSALKRRTRAKGPNGPELIPIFLAWSMPRNIATSPWTGCKSIAKLPQAVRRRYPYIHLGEEKQSGVVWPCLLVYLGERIYSKFIKKLPKNWTSWSHWNTIWAVIHLKFYLNPWCVHP